MDIHHHETTQIHAHTIKQRTRCGPIPTSLDPTKQVTTGVGRFGANMLRWGLSTSDCCECGAEQTAEHITSGRCPIYRPPEGIHGLIELDVMTRTWLENCAMDV